MDADEADVHRTLEYRTATTFVRLLPTGLLLIFLGLALLVLVDADREAAPLPTFVGIGLCFLFGGALIGIALWRLANHGKPLFALSPAGIHYRIPCIKEVLIPWSGIRGVDKIDIHTGHWSLLWSTKTLRYNKITFRDVTVVLITKEFYEARIFVDSFFLRGPGWKNNFIPKGRLVQLALHHELVSVEPQPLREAVEARWNAFREQPAGRIANAGKPSVEGAHAASGTDVVAMGERPTALSWWEAVKIIVPLVGIVAGLANLAGLWELPGQSEAREARAQARAEREHLEETSRRMKEEWKRREEKQRELEELMKRTFGE